MGTGINLGGGGDTSEIEAELGADPSGSFDSVAARLNASLRGAVVNPAAASMFTIPGFDAASSTSTFNAFASTALWYFPIFVRDYLTFDRVAAEVTVASGTGGAVGRVGIYNATSSWQPTGTLIEDFGTFATDSTGVKTVTPSGGSRTIPGGRYLLAFQHSVVSNPTFTVARGTLSGAPMFISTLSTGTYIQYLSVTRTYGALDSSPPAWTSVAGNSTGMLYPLFLRVSAEG